MTIFRKGLVLVALPLLFQLAFIGLLAWMQATYVAAQDWSLHTKEVIAQAQLVLSGVVDAETSIRGYALTNNPAFTETFDRATRDLPGQLDRLQFLVRDNPDQEARAGQIRSTALEAMAWYVEAARLVRAGALNQAVARANTGNGKRLMDELRREVAAFLDEEGRLDGIRLQALEGSRRQFNWLLAAATAAGFAVTFGLAVVFSRGIGRRLAVLTENARRLARGQELTAPLEGGDEIAGLDRTFRDMAGELARSGEALRQQTRILTSVLDSMGDAVVVADETGKFLVFNPAATRLLGLGATDAPPEQWSQTYGTYLPDQHTLCPAGELPLVRAMRGEAVDDAELVVRRAGRSESTWITVTGRPLRNEDGALIGGVVVCRDVTERKRAEEALRRSEERFRLMMESAGDYALIFLDPEGRVVDWNAGAKRLKGYRLEEIVGKHFSCFYPAEAVARGWPSHELEMASREGRFEDEGWRVRKDGTQFWANVVITALRTREGRLGGFAKLTRDLTERKRTEDTVRRFNDELEERVAQRTAELTEANRQLAQRNQENEMFVYSVSHDLRSPLVNLEGFSEELALACNQLRLLFPDEGLPPAVRARATALIDRDMAQAIHFIRTAVARLSAIIDALLRLSRAGRVQYKLQSVDLNATVARVVEALAGTTHARGAAVTVHDLPPAWGDPTALEQVFANLIGNAVNYLDPRRPGVVEVGALAGPAADGQVTYFVKDNGLGIPEAHRPKVFQVFQRLHPQAAPGEGLGLAIVQRVVERQRGRVWLDSTPGVGTTFFVSLLAPTEGAANPDNPT